MERRVSPCMYCTRVRDPRACENKNCMLWRSWFVERWEAMRAAVREKMDAAPTEPVGAVVSGRHYAAPAQIERYLHNDPCDSCLCPKSLCRQSCRVRRSWLQAREDVLL